MSDFRILGPLEVIDGDGPIAVGSPKERTLLAMLLIDAAKVVPVDRLTEGLWGEQAPASARNTVRTYVSHLRRAFEQAGVTDTIETVGGGYLLNVEPERVDSHRFARLVEEGRKASGEGSYSEASKAFSDALDLWRGPALVELPDDDIARTETQRLEELRLYAVEESIAADLHLGQHLNLIPKLETLVARHPTRERLGALLMTALYRSGRQAEALGVYQEVRKTLGDDLGIEPGPELQQLEESILLQDPALDLEPTPPVAEHNLPASLTSFVGRNEEIDTTRSLLASARLVTLTGQGGSGKTRLALETAALLTGDYHHGVHWVDLGSVSDQDRVAITVATVFRLGGSPGHDSKTGRLGLLDELAAYLHSRSLLLILDSCEHLIEEVALLVKYVLERSESVQIIATSREPLHVTGEHLLRVGPLGVPQEGATMSQLLAAAAGRLLVDRATAADAGFTVQDPAAVAQICRRLDGIPLALELVASRLAVMSAAEVVDRLENRFAVLTGGARGVPARHRTIRETLEWSYDLLSEEERGLFRRIAIFSGEFSLEATSALADPSSDTVLENLASLVEKSLVNVERTGGATRYRLLETVREFGRELLEAHDETDAAGRAHAGFYVEVAEKADAGAQTTDQQVWFRLLDDNLGNLRRALTWTAESDPDSHLRLVGSLGWYWYSRGHVIEGLDWLEAAISMTDLPGSLRAKALNRAALLAYGQGDAERISTWSEEALELSRSYDDIVEQSWALVLRSQAAVLDQRLDIAAGYLSEGIARAEEGGNSWAKAWGLMLTGHALRNIEAFEDSEEVSAEAARLFGEVGEMRGIAYVHLNRAGLSAMRGEARLGVEFAHQALETLEQSHDVFGIGLACSYLAALSAGDSRWEDAVRYSLRCLELGASIGGRWFPSVGLSVLGWVAADHGSGALAARLYGAAEAIFIQPGIRVVEERWLRRDRLADELPHETYLAATKEGTNATPTEVEVWAREAGLLVGVETSKDPILLHRHPRNHSGSPSGG